MELIIPLRLRLLLAVLPTVLFCASCGGDHSHDLIDIGEHVSFQPPSGIDVVADSEETYGKWLDAASADDKAGELELVSSGRVDLVDAGTKLLILAYGRIHFTSLYKFRILEGKDFGKAAWAPQQYVRRDAESVTK